MVLRAAALRAAAVAAHRVEVLPQAVRPQVLVVPVDLRQLAEAALPVVVPQVAEPRQAEAVASADSPEPATASSIRPTAEFLIRLMLA